MSQYIMLPGAELEIGPGGKPYETLGACCAGCASGSNCEGVGNDTAGAVGTIVVLGAAAAFGLAVLFPRVWKRYTKSLWG